MNGNIYKVGIVIIISLLIYGGILNIYILPSLNMLEIDPALYAILVVSPMFFPAIFFIISMFMGVTNGKN